MVVHEQPGPVESGAVHLRAGDDRLVVQLDGGRWTSWVAGGQELLGRGGDRLVDHGCFVMAPWAGRVRDGRLAWRGHVHQLPLLEPPHALHGTVLDRPWDVAEATAARAVLTCELDSRWPWRGRVVQSLALAEGELRADVRVETRDEEMPAWVGLHPWLRRALDGGARAEVDAPADGVLARDQAGIATPRLVEVPDQPWDDSFEGVRWPVTVRWPGELSLEMSAESSAVEDSGPPVAVVFTAKERAVAVEPQSAPPDAAGLGRAAVVAPGRPLVLSTTWRWRLTG